MDYLIRQINGDEFDLSLSDYPRVLRPNTVESTLVEPNGCVTRVKDCLIYFSPESSGLQMSFDGVIDASVADAIVNEILSNLENFTGEKGTIIRI